MRNRDFLPGFMTVFGLAVAMLFLAFGLYIIFSRQLNSIPTEFRNILGIVIIGYGLFRSVIIYQKSRRRRDEDETGY